MSSKVSTKFQPHLGRHEQVYKPDLDMGKRIALAKVVTVHHKRNTADVQLIKSDFTISSSSTNEGKYGAKILVSSAHFNALDNTCSGVVEPIQEGQLVMLAFLDGLKNEPIIIGSAHDTFVENHNILTRRYPINPVGSSYDKREALKYKRVFPSQAYCVVDGLGGMEYSLPSKSFLKIDSEFYSQGLNDNHLGTDHESLEEKDEFYSLTTRSGRTFDTRNAVKMLFVHRSSYFDDQTTWTKFFIDVDGTFRLTRDNRDDKLSYIELDNKGNFKVRRQLDSPDRDNGNNYSDIRVNEDGSICIERKSQNKVSNIHVDSTGQIHINQGSGSSITLNNSGEVIINCTDFIVNKI